MATPTDETPSNGSRSVTNSDLQRELRLLNSEIGRKLDLMIQKAEYADRAQESLAQDVKKNAADVLLLRDHWHTMATTIQQHEGLASVLSLDCARELVVALPFLQQSKDLFDRRQVRDLPDPAELAWVRTAMRELSDDKIKRLAEAAERRAEKEQRWFGLSREFVMAGSGIAVLLLANNGIALWHVVFH